MTHTIPGPPPGAGAWLAGGALVVVCVAGGCVEVVEPGAGAVELDAPVEVLEPPVPAPPLGELLLAAAPPLAPLAAAAVAALSIPPCPLQAPRPPWGEVVPSLHVTGLPVSASALVPGSMSNAAVARTPKTNEAHLRIRIGLTSQ